MELQLNESRKPYVDNKEQKLLFLVVSQSEVHIDFDFAFPLFLQVRLRMQIKLHAQIIGRVELNFFSPPNDF